MMRAQHKAYTYSHKLIHRGKAGHIVAGKLPYHPLHFLLLLHYAFKNGCVSNAFGYGSFACTKRDLWACFGLPFCAAFALSLPDPKLI